MKKRIVGIRELKAQASRVVNEVREEKEPYVVTKRGQPVAVIRPWGPADESEERLERVRRSLDQLDDLAQRVGRSAGRRSAAAAVAKQRR